MNRASPEVTLSQIASTAQWFIQYSTTHFVAEAVLTVGFLLAILIDVILRNNRILQRYLPLFGVLVLLVAAYFATTEWHAFDPQHPNSMEGGKTVFHYTQSLFAPKVTHPLVAGKKGIAVEGQYSMAVVDNFSIFFKLLVAATGVIVLLMSMASKEIVNRRYHIGEFTSLILGVSIGLFLMPASTDLVMMYISLELVSIGSYVLSAFVKDRAKNAEASMKYVLFGALSSGLMIYGFSLFYGLTGTTNIIGIRQILASNPATHIGANYFILWTATALSLAGMAYKISAVPFHFWTPDVYEGAPTPVTAFLSVASKAAGFGLLIRFLIFTFPQSSLNDLPLINWSMMLAIVSVVTMTFGNLAALLQSNVKRMLAYSSIAHAGYMLAGIVVGGSAGIVAILIYLACYLAMNLGAFYCVMLISEEIGSESIEDFRGLMQRAPLACSALVIFLVSLIGLPATSGFVGKLYLFTAILRTDPITHTNPWVWLAVVAVVNSIISLYYYLRVAGSMFLKRSWKEIAVEKLGSAEIIYEPSLAISVSAKALIVALVIPTIALGLFFQPLVEVASGVVRFFNFDNIKF